jgi:hypothetical protein
VPFLRRSRAPKPQVKTGELRSHLRRGAEVLLDESDDIDVLRSAHAGYSLIDLLLENWSRLADDRESFLDAPLNQWRHARAVRLSHAAVRARR